MATINLGRVKPVFRGAYAGGTAYVVDDIVTSGNETFICIQASTGNATSNASYWTKLAAKGTDGTDGTDVGTVITTQGDMLYRDGSGLQRLAKGTAGKALIMNSSANAPEWGSAGGLNQFVTARDATVKTRTSNGTLDLVSLNITPSSTSSKILLMMQTAWGYSAGGNSPNAGIYPKRAISGGATTNLSQEAATGSSPGAVVASEIIPAFGAENQQPLSGHYVDEPNTTSQITYTLVFSVSDGGSHTTYVGSPGSTNTASWHWRTPHTLTAIEVVV
jgi:hypothetical protein